MVRIGFLLFLAALLSLPVACQQRPPGVDFAFLNGAEPQTLDPAQISGQLEGRLANALFEGLTTRDEFGNVVPGIAERWEVDETGKIYRFYLRDAKWSNGDQVTAHDFYDSWKRVLTPDTASPYAEIMFPIPKAEDYQTGRISDFSEVGISAVDPRTLVVTLANPTPYFTDLTAFTTYLPVHLKSVNQLGDQWMKPGQLVSNGAYTLTGWRINDRVELTRNPHYWRKETVAFRRIDALAVNEANTAFNLYSTGQADLILDKGLIPTAFVDKLKDRPDCHVAPFLACLFVRFNVSQPPFDNRDVREAFNRAIDKGRIVERITRMGEPIARSFTPPGLPGYDPPKGPDYDTERARELMAQAGFPNGRGFPRVTYLYNDSEQNKQIAEQLQSMWSQELGVQVDLQTMDWSRYLNAMNDLQYDLARSSWVGDYADPNTFLDCFVTGRGNNRTGWSNAEYDRLMQEANASSDPKVRFSLLREAETILVAKEMPIAPIYHNVGVQFYDASRLGGMQPNVIDEHPLRCMFWKDSRN